MNGLTIDTVAVPMRDGVALATDVWRPAGPGPWPVLLARTPYGRTSLAHLGNQKLPDVRALVDGGYAVVVQDVRGTSGSPGLFEPHRYDLADTVDTLSWIAGRPWCDGAVGMWGGSYLGFPQWHAAAQAPAALRAIAPAMTSGDAYRAWYSAQGALSQGTVFNWAARVALANLSRPGVEARPGDAAEIQAALDRPGILHAHPDRLRDALFRALPWLREMLAHPGRDAYWEPFAPLEHSASMTVPALNVTGWYDIFVREVVHSYTTLRRTGGSEAARDGQRLIIGPWGHGDGADLGVFPDRSFGLAGSIRAAGLTAAHLRFFDRWVKGRTDAPPGARVRIFVMGVDRWRDEEDWPLPDTRYRDLFLHGDGRLDPEPAPGEGGDVFASDPRDPVPTVGAPTLGADGPADQSAVERRDDVLCYTGEQLEAPLEATGHVRLTVHLSSSAADTDVTGKLVDVFPDGRAIILCEGLCRLRHRDSLTEPSPSAPDEVVEVTVDLGVTANVFQPGHRVRLEIAGSNFPRYDLNGGPATVNRILHGPAHPSRLTLPVIENSQERWAAFSAL